MARFSSRTAQPGRRTQPPRRGESSGSERSREPLSEAQKLHSPYNFVPLSEHVFVPELEAVFDPFRVPFRDGYSGEIELRVTAQTPIYIRRSGVRASPPTESGADPEPESFYRLPEPDGRYALPGSSVKGMLRSALEIASFSRLATSLEEKRFAVRDLSARGLYADWMSRQVNGAFEPTVKAAWLSQRLEEGESAWFLEPCEFARVEQALLEQQCGANSMGPRGNKASDAGTARRKYAAWGTRSLQVQCSVEPAAVHGVSARSSFRYAKVTSISGGAEIGTLVFTGQPADRKPGSATKRREFLFYRESGQEHQVPARLRDEFLFVHEELDPSASGDWSQRWKARLRAGERVPVFYLAYRGAPRADAPTLPLGAQGAELYALGLAMMFRLPYRHPVGHGLPPAHRARGGLDTAQRIFGTVEGEALRGRVQVEAFAASGSPRTLPVVSAVLSNPKPSFFPNYVEQAFGAGDPERLKDRGYRTYMDDAFRLRGWKRYPVPADGAAVRTNPAPNGSSRVATHFVPLAAQTEFAGRVRFQNLRRWELGALIWSITFGDLGPYREAAAGQPLYRHSLGLAKPLGYGSVEVRITRVAAVDAHGEPSRSPLGQFLADGMAAFEERITEWLGKTGLGAKLEDTAPIRELRAMADPAHYEAASERLDYPRSGPGEVADPQAFRGYKKRQQILPRYSVLAGEPALASAAGVLGAAAGSQKLEPGAVVEVEVVPPLRQRPDGTPWPRFCVKGGDSTRHGGGIDRTALSSPLFADIALGKTYRLRIKRANSRELHFELPDDAPR